MMNEKIYLKVSEDDPYVGYLYLPGHPGEKEHGIVSKQIRLLDVIDNYKGPDLYLDIDSVGKVIGIEILA